MNPDRRDVLALGVGALAVAVLPSALRPRPALVRRRIPVMGTVAEVAVRHRDATWAQRGIDAAFAELRRVEALMTRFRDDSDVGRANLQPLGERVPISEETASVLRTALAWARGSEGRFDPCLGRAVEMWDVAHRTTPPGGASVVRFAGVDLWRALDVESGSTSTVRLHRSDAALDLGGIAKGYAVDAAARALRDHGVAHGLVNVGGDLVALGTDARDEPWSVGVRSPTDPGELVEIIPVSDAAVATSGDYLQFFQHGGRRYHHLLDPATGEPRRTGMRSLTVEAGSCMEADAAATALFGGSPHWIETVLSRTGSAARIVHELQENEA